MADTKYVLLKVICFSCAQHHVFIECIRYQEKGQYLSIGLELKDMLYQMHRWLNLFIYSFAHLANE